MKKSRVKFHWVVLGIGSLKEELEKKREELGVQDCFEFIGARENPYAYMKNADVLVQSSRFEGKSVVLDEGKICAAQSLQQIILRYMIRLTRMRALL